MRNKLHKTLGKKVPLGMITDSACPFNVGSRSSRTSKRKLMVNIVATRDVYVKKEIDDVDWISDKGSITDDFTKVIINESLQSFLDTGKLQKSLSTDYTHFQCK